MNRRQVSLALCAAIALVACSKRAGAPSAGRPFTDMTGKTISLAGPVRKAFSTSPMGTTLSYTFDPELLLGWNYALNDVDAPFIVAKYRALPVLGGWFGANASVNVERLMQSKPDVLLSVGNSPDSYTRDRSFQLSEKTGVPVAFFTLYRMEDAPRVYEAMGALTGNTERAAALSSYAKRIVDRARDISGRVQPGARVRVYYAEGLKGLNTEPRGNMHSELIDFCAGENVASIQENNVSGYGNTPVSMEQVVAWNPDIILISDYLGKDGGTSGWRRVLDDNPLWRRVKAVQDHKVFVVPRSPFQWIDRPPSVNRLAGLIWLPALFYPALCQYDLKSEIRQFYDTFYHQQLTEEALNALLDTAVRL